MIVECALFSAGMFLLLLAFGLRHKRQHERIHFSGTGSGKGLAALLLAFFFIPLGVYMYMYIADTELLAQYLEDALEVRDANSQAILAG